MAGGASGLTPPRFPRGGTDFLQMDDGDAVSDPEPPDSWLAGRRPVRRRLPDRRYRVETVSEQPVRGPLAPVDTLTAAFGCTDRHRHPGGGSPIHVVERAS